MKYNEDILLELEDHFDRFKWKWSIKDRGLVQPDRYDFKAALDEVARILYSEDVDGNMLQVGRLIIIKQDTGLDVYVLAGTIDV